MEEATRAVPVQRENGEATDRRTTFADVQRIVASLSPLPAPVGAGKRPTLVVLSGLPGSGKSYFQRQLRERTGAVVLESDVLRKLLFDHPVYTPEEHARLFRALRIVAEQLLRARRSVIIDATNLTEWERLPYYKMAERLGVRLLIVRLTAPEAVVRARLERRAMGKDETDYSDADLSVYDRMQHHWEEISRPHYSVDTSQEITPAIEAVAQAMEAEEQ